MSTQYADAAIVSLFNILSKALLVNELTLTTTQSNFEIYDADGKLVYRCSSIIEVNGFHRGMNARPW